MAVPNMQVAQLSTAIQGGKLFPGVEQSVGIEGRLNSLELAEFSRGELTAHGIYLLGAYPVLPCNAAALIYTSLEDRMA